ncbi:MAG: hypothetical protein VXZ67_01585 [Pseudomonadota bacterium]|nr:hypothetical protein [Pseudomonadota bacterium]
MSRLAEAHAKLEAALQQLEAALASRPGPDTGTVNAGDALDRAAIIAEIASIDEQLSSAMQMIDHARQVSGSEGGTA